MSLTPRRRVRLHHPHSRIGASPGTLNPPEGAEPTTVSVMAWGPDALVEQDEVDLPLLQEAGLQKGTRPPVFVSGIHDVHAGFVYRTDDGGIVVTFRGPLPPQDMILWRWAADWLHDAQTVPMPWTVGDRAYGQVATAFGVAVTSLATDLLETLETLNAGSASAIRITGQHLLQLPCDVMLGKGFFCAGRELSVDNARHTIDRVGVGEHKLIGVLQQPAVRVMINGFL